MVGGSPPSAPKEPRASARAIDRRRLLRLGFLASLAALIAAAIAALARFIYPHSQAVDNYVNVDPSKVPVAGDPPLEDKTGNFYLVNLRANEGLWGNDDHTAGGFVAFSSICTHLRCHIAWEPAQHWQTEREFATGLFVCHCHDSIFTKAGVKIFGPAPRSMDPLELEPLSDGTLRVHATKVHKGTAAYAPPDPKTMIPPSQS